MAVGAQIIEVLKIVVMPLTIFAILIYFRKETKSFCEVLLRRVANDESIKVAGIELKAAPLPVSANTGRKGYDLFLKSNEFDEIAATEGDFNSRKVIRYSSEFIRLVHQTTLSGNSKYPYNIIVYLKSEKILPELDQDRNFRPARLNDIDYVDYYFGKYFGKGQYGSWFRMRDGANSFAVSYLTEDEVTCIARVKFHNNPEPIELVRYLDYEMGILLQNSTMNAVVDGKTQ